MENVELNKVNTPYAQQSQTRQVMTKNYKSRGKSMSYSRKEIKSKIKLF